MPCLFMDSEIGGPLPSHHKALNARAMANLAGGMNFSTREREINFHVAEVRF